MVPKAQRTMFCYFKAQIDNKEDDNQCAEVPDSGELTLVFPMSKRRQALKIYTTTNSSRDFELAC